MLREKPLLTIVVPVFNEEKCLDALFSRLCGLRERMAGETHIEFLFVNDGSRDRTAEILDTLAKECPFVKVVALSRNFGHQIAVTAGIDHSKGEWVALIDADLQDPPEALFEMFRLAQEGYDVVYGVRKSRRGETFLKQFTAASFYRILRYLCEIDIPRDTGDFRIISRRVADALCSMREHHRFIRGMVPWVGYKSIGHYYDRDERYAGETKYPLSKMLHFAVNAILSFSSKPLALATRFGIMTVVLGILGAAYMLYLKLFTDIPVPGITAVIVTIVIFGGAQILLTGLVGEYVARIFEEAKRRPLYVVAETRNL